MATSDSELVSEVRSFTDYSDIVLGDDDFDTIVGRAKRHVAVKKSVDPEEFDWFDPSDPAREAALFWWSCLFAKVSVGEIDGNDVQIGAVNISAIRSGDDDDAIVWLREAQGATRQIDTGGDSNYGVGIGAPSREERVYGEDDTGTGTGLDSL